MPMLTANVEVSDKGGPAPNLKNGPKWVEGGRQVLRIGPRESHGSSGAFGTGLAHSIFFFGPRWGGLTPPSRKHATAAAAG